MIYKKVRGRVCARIFKAGNVRKGNFHYIINFYIPVKLISEKMYSFFPAMKLDATPAGLTGTLYLR